MRDSLARRLDRIEGKITPAGDPGEAIVHHVASDEEAERLKLTLDRRKLHVIKRTYTDEMRLGDFFGNTEPLFRSILREIDGLTRGIPT